MIDATVVGTGPNGLAAAVTLARAGLRVRVHERNPTVGGGIRSAELTLPGFVHDVCSAVHPAALQSRFFRQWGLLDRVPFVIPEASYAHPFEGGETALAWRDLDRTADELGRDGSAFRRLLAPLVARVDGVDDLTTGGSLLRPPASPPAAMRFALRALEQGGPLWSTRFREDAAPALLTGVMAHSIARLPSLAAAGAGLLLATEAHAAGWGFPVGGAQSLADALAADVLAHGGEIVTGSEVRSRSDLEPSTVTLLDTSPEFLARFTELPAAYARALSRYRRGPAVAKVDFALSSPVPWSDPRTALAPTVHLGGTRGQIRASEHAVLRSRVPQRPYVLVTQPSILDATRAPEGRHTVWAYIHVPAGSTLDATELVTAQIERYAPGFRDVVLASVGRSAVDLERDNPNDVGGEMTGGAITMWQLAKRPVISRTPWRTPVAGLYLGSAATPPGPAVHGMAGYLAALTALGDHFGAAAPVWDAAKR